MLVLTVERQPGWADCLTGLAMLCKYDAEGVRYRKVTVLGLKDRKDSTQIETLLGLAEKEVEVTDVGVQRLRKGFDELAASPLAADMPLLLKLLSKSFEAHIPASRSRPKDDKDLELEDILPSKHNKHTHEDRIVMPEQFDLERFNRIAAEMFQYDKEVERLPRPSDTPKTAKKKTQAK